MPGKYPRFQPLTVPRVPQFIPPPATIPLPQAPVIVNHIPDPFESGVPLLHPNSVDAVKWGYKRMFDGSDFKTAFDRFSVFFASAFARATGTDDADMHAYLLKMIDGDGFTIHTETVGDIPVKWYEYQTGPFRLVSFPGTANFRQWASYARPIMIVSPDGPTGVTMYYGVSDILHAHLTAFLAYYNSQIVANFPTFALIGHSIGGAIAHHIALQVDRAAPDTGSKPFNSMMSAYSFGAPAFMHVPDDVDFGAFKVRTIRTVNPGDPVPDLAQQAIAGFNSASHAVAGPMFVPPDHYALRSWLVNGRVPRANGFWASLDQLRKGAIDAVSKTFDRHRMWSYAASLEKSCRDFSDTPYPGFSIVVEAHHRLAALGA